MFTRTALNRLFSVEMRKNGLRVENQSRSWSLKDLDRHAEAFSMGLQEMGFKQSKFCVKR